MTGGGKPKDITRTTEWEGAEFAFAEVVASTRLAFFGETLTARQIDERMTEILEGCPEFYPALLQRGVYLSGTGRDEEAVRLLDRAFELVVEMLDGQDLIDAVDQVIDGLEERLRYDLCGRYLGRLLEMYPKQALYYDYWAGDELRRRNGSIEKAVRLQQEALRLAPANPTFHSNLGWIHLTAGELEAAGRALEKALSIEPNHRSAKGNMEVLRYLEQRRGGGTFTDFLLRPVDDTQLTWLQAEQQNTEDTDESIPLIAEYNQCRMQAFQENLIAEGDRPPHRAWNLKTTLWRFFDFVEEVLPVRFLFDDVQTLHHGFKVIMHRFIVSFEDVDDEIIEDVHASLQLFYSFLSRRGLVPGVLCGDFLGDIGAIKPQMLDKMRRYNRIRHDHGLSEAEKEEIRCELFEGDHWVPL